MKNPFLLVSGCRLIPARIHYVGRNQISTEHIRLHLHSSAVFYCKQHQTWLDLDSEDEFKANPQPKASVFVSDVTFTCGRKENQVNSLVTTPFMFNGQWALRSIRIIGRLSRLLRGCCLIVLWWNSYMQSNHDRLNYLLQTFGSFNQCGRDILICKFKLWRADQWHGVWKR